MKVLVACEFSGVVRDAFIARGHDAISCDLDRSERRGPHYRGDVRDLLDEGWDLMIAHPPCTHLAISGNANPNRLQSDEDDALDLVRTLMMADIPKICVENPVSVISTYIRKPDQIVHPWWFGDPYKKRTCLWLKGLPLLRKQSPHPHPDPDYFHILPPGPQRAKMRARFLPGFANAMATQWG